MTKTYALFDLIGVSEAFGAGRAGQMLTQFWKAADAWVNTGAFSENVQLEKEKGIERPQLQLITFSDSAIMQSKREYRIDDFYGIIKHFMAHIRQNVAQLYCIVSRGEHISAPGIPALGGTTIYNGHVPAYLNIGGSGAAWVNLHLSDKFLKCKKEWHKKYTIYCVGQESKPQGMNPRGMATFTGFGGKSVQLIALR